ncbi:hypothetical protein BDY24DRAFT_409115 [Mrakia frigida]|uniref:uncharacterized protein n=1 Tax=Mrakia frigida TaxID=29902 RepID=UPI003FCC012B
MSVAVLYGASSGIGLHLARHILSTTSLEVVALSSRAPKHTTEAILGGGGNKERLSVFEVDGLKDTDRGMEKAAEEIKKRWGEKGSVRMVVCSAGVLHPEKSITQIDPFKSLETFQLNTLSHLLAYKHFVPLIPTQKQLTSLFPEGSEEDPAMGLLRRDLSLCLSVSARVGSVGDNRTGGWYSYRSSKTALNQIIKTLSLELHQKKSSSISLAYHPGTTKTNLSSPFVDQSKPSKPEQGLFEVEESVEKLVALMKTLKGGKEEAGGDSGGFRDWKGERVVW